MDYYKTEFVAILIPLVLVICLFIILIIFILERKNNTRFSDYFSLRWWTKKDYDTCPEFYKTYSSIDICNTRCDNNYKILNGQTPYTINPFGALLFTLIFIGFVVLIIMVIRRVYLSFTAHTIEDYDALINVQDIFPTESCNINSNRVKQSVTIDDINNLLKK